LGCGKKPKITMVNKENYDQKLITKQSITINLTKTRIDKWLWAIRVYKTRSQATNACKAGRVKIKGETVKASYMITPGEIVVVRKGPLKYTYKVVAIIEKRMSAKKVADKFVDLTPEEDKTIKRLPSAFHIPTVIRKRGEGRPTKKERREMDKLKDDIDSNDFE